MLIWLSGAGEFHPYALQDPYVTVSRHTAPNVQPMAESQIPKTQIAWAHGVQCDPTSESPLARASQRLMIAREFLFIGIRSSFLFFWSESTRMNPSGLSMSVHETLISSLLRKPV